MTRTQRPVVMVVGAGAAGALTALHLVRSVALRSATLDILVIDPAGPVGAGTAFGTTDEEHLLNVPAAGMSALPEDPGHFVAWRRRVAPDSAHAYEFAPRRDYATYLDETMRDALATAAGGVTMTHRRRTAVGVERSADGITLGLDDGTSAEGDALVLATGLPSAGHTWGPEGLIGSAFFISDPWAPGALELVRRDRSGPPDVLAVGTGLTMVDVVHSVTTRARADRTVHAISRSGRLPHRHAGASLLAATPEVSGWGSDLSSIKENVARHLAQVESATGDWRPAVDGLRFQLTNLWGRLSEEDRLRFLHDHAGAWNRLRHRIPGSSADRLDDLISVGHLTVSSAQVSCAEPLPRGGLRVKLSDGASREVGWVVNCTGPQTDVRELGNPLLDDLLRPRVGASLAVPSTAGLGLRTDRGRLVDSAGDRSAPVWALGALRRGDLWESTAVPEIRAQALAVAGAVLDEIAPMPRRLADGRAGAAAVRSRGSPLPSDRARPGLRPGDERAQPRRGRDRA